MAVVKPLIVEIIFGEGGTITEYDEHFFRAGEGYIDTSIVFEKTYTPFVIGAHEADADDIAFLTLERVYCGDIDVVVQFELRIFSVVVFHILYLSSVGGYDSYAQVIVLVFKFEDKLA